MRLFTNKRVRDIFNQIAQGTVTQSALAQAMNVSTRTIRSDLKALSDIVSHSGNSLIYDRKKGFSIDVADRAGFSSLLEQSQRPWKEARCAAERRRALLTALLHQDGAVSLEALEARWFISIYSLRNDVAVLRRHFAHYAIAVQADGQDRLTLAGSETALRRCIYEHLLQAKDVEEEYQTLFATSGRIADLKQSLSQAFLLQGLALSDVNLRFFTLICAIACGRIRAGRAIGGFTFPDVEPQWQQLAGEILQLQLAVSGVEQSEVDYLAMNLAAFCSALPLGQPNAGLYVAEQAVMNHFLSYISSAWFCELNYDDLSRENLLRHITAMRIRVNFGITIINPLIEQIKRHYPLIYEMTLAAFSELDLWFSGPISDDEIGYLVMHIGAILEETQSRDAQHPVTALLVSDQGDAATRLVCQKIIRMYPNIMINRCLSVARYQQLAQVEEDLVVTLAEVEEKHPRTISLPPLPDRGQLESIKPLLSVARPSPEAMSNWFPAAHFTIIRDADYDKAALIAMMAGQLQSSGRVDTSYADSVMEREARASTLLDDKIAIPHPMGLVALSTVVAVAIFPQGIEWDEGKVVRLVFMLAISGDAFADSMLIYDYLTNILDDDVIDKLSQSDSHNDFILRSENYFLQA